MDDRIKLAEAMGWGVGEDTFDGQEIGVPPGDTRPYGQGNLTQMPDPFTDANDDYAVLEWMRNEFTGDQIALALFRLRDNNGPSSLSKYYQIGNYARAALTVLDGNAKGLEQSDE